MDQQIRCVVIACAAIEATAVDTKRDARLVRGALGAQVRERPTLLFSLARALILLRDALPASPLSRARLLQLEKLFALPVVRRDVRNQLGPFLRIALSPSEN